MEPGVLCTPPLLLDTSLSLSKNLWVHFLLLRLPPHFHYRPSPSLLRDFWRLLAAFWWVLFSTLLFSVAKTKHLAILQLVTGLHLDVTLGSEFHVPALIPSAHLVVGPCLCGLHEGLWASPLEKWMIATRGGYTCYQLGPGSLQCISCFLHGSRELWGHCKHGV